MPAMTLPTQHCYGSGNDNREAESDVDGNDDSDETWIRRRNFHPRYDCRIIRYLLSPPTEDRVIALRC